MTDYQFKVLVVLVSLWGAVLEGTLLAIRVGQMHQVQTIEFEVLPQAQPVYARELVASAGLDRPLMVTPIPGDSLIGRCR
jgi:hypothetical protein